ncbi:hypothetical protein [Pyrococcus kukulkanii]|uniref:hypothetical protein n=1 Tax=Pyrococcus kukulkanii TaxID=1609559 RepID=UPI003563004B
MFGFVKRLKTALSILAGLFVAGAGAVAQQANTYYDMYYKPMKEAVEERLEPVRAKYRGRRGAGVIDGLIGFMVVIIIAVAVALPIIKDTIEKSNMTGTEGTILSYVPLMIVIGIFMMAVGFLRGRG